MSILKSILHHYNKTTKSYDTLHPETESAQVTDWNNGIVNTLASTALGGLVNTLTSDSLLATMIQKVLTATGVKYNIAQNGYLCFGSLFGGLIIQWVKSTEPSGKTYDDISFPISFAQEVYQIIPVDWDSTSSLTKSRDYTFMIVDTKTTLTGTRIATNETAGYYKALIIGR